jgi:hypothetical protein
MEKISRRDFTKNMLGSLFSMTLISSLVEAQSLKGSIKPIAHNRIFEMEEISKDLRRGKIKPVEWQEQIESLLGQIEMKDLLKAIDYQQLAKSTKLFDDHETAEEVTFSSIKKLSGELSFAPYFYGMKKGVSIVPHGHQNMTTMHIMLKGEAHGRHYDRIADETEFLIIKPTKDKNLTVGDASTISDQRDNIHWFEALTEPVFMFNIGVYGLDENAATTGRDYIDPNKGENLSNGSIRVPRITGENAYKIYGKSR